MKLSSPSEYDNDNQVIAYLRYNSTTIFILALAMSVVTKFIQIPVKSEHEH